ncbi:MAG: hypothetical protein WCG47_00340 [Dermatophilaceae bacterium]
MDVEIVRLSFGAFLTSPGFAGLAALATALVAVRGVNTRVSVERELAHEAQRHASAEARAAAERHREERRQAEALVRWWELTRWINVQLDRENVDKDLLMSLLVELEALVSTREQSIMLEFLTKRLLQVASPQPHA